MVFGRTGVQGHWVTMDRRAASYRAPPMPLRSRSSAPPRLRVPRLDHQMVRRIAAQVRDRRLGDVEPEEAGAFERASSSGGGISTSAPDIFASPGHDVRGSGGGSSVGLWIATRGSRRTSASLRDPPIIPSVSSPSSNLHSVALIRGEPIGPQGRQRLVGAGLETPPDLGRELRGLVFNGFPTRHGNGLAGGTDRKSGDNGRRPEGRADPTGGTASHELVRRTARWRSTTWPSATARWSRCPT